MTFKKMILTGVDGKEEVYPLGSVEGDQCLIPEEGAREHLLYKARQGAVRDESEAYTLAYLRFIRDHDCATPEKFSDQWLAEITFDALNQRRAECGGKIITLGEDWSEEEWAVWDNDPHKRWCSGDNYVVGLPSDDENEGWFPLGNVSLIFGSSGAGKTTWALQMLQGQLGGERVADHQTYRLPFIMLMLDRGEFAMRRTFRRLKIDPSSIPIRMLPADSFKRDPAGIVEEYYLADFHKRRAELAEYRTGKAESAEEDLTQVPRIVFIEGLDLWIPKASDMDHVVPILNRLEAVATKYNLAIISTIGSPKMKPKERYSVARDSAYGSQVFARMTETMVHVLENEETHERYITVMPRNGKPEKFTTRFKAGRLETTQGIVVGPAPEENAGKAAFLAWCTEKTTWEEAQREFGIGRSLFFEWKAEAKAKRLSTT